LGSLVTLVTLVTGLPGGVGSPTPLLPAARVLVANMSTNRGYVVKTFTVVKTFIRRSV